MASLDRRAFLRILAGSGVVLGAPTLLTHSGRAFADEAGGGSERFWVFVHAQGGWDTTMLCDPKGRLSVDETDPVNTYLTSDITQHGAHRCPPIPAVQAFFTKHGGRTLTLNGLDCQTNSHDAGARHAASGRLAAGWPCFSALIAAQHGANKPLAFVSNGGYDFAAGVAPVTRINDVGLLGNIVKPDHLSASQPATYHSDKTAARIQAAQQARLAAAMQRDGSARARDAMATLFGVRGGDNELAKLLAVMPKNLESGLKRQAQLAVAGFKSGLVASAQMALGGFDTHGNHDS